MRLELLHNQIVVVLSQRNLLSLLHKLEMPGSARTLVCGDNRINDEPVHAPILVVQVEADVEHYGARLEPAGPMHPATESFVERVRRGHHKLPDAATTEDDQP